MRYLSQLLSTSLIHDLCFDGLLLLEMCLHQVACLLELCHGLAEADADQVLGLIIADVQRADLRHSHRHVSIANVRKEAAHGERPDVKL